MESGLDKVYRNGAKCVYIFHLYRVARRLCSVESHVEVAFKFLKFVQIVARNRKIRYRCNIVIEVLF